MSVKGIFGFFFNQSAKSQPETDACTAAVPLFSFRGRWRHTAYVHQLLLPHNKRQLCGKYNKSIDSYMINVHIFDKKNPMKIDLS